MNLTIPCGVTMRWMLARSSRKRSSKGIPDALRLEGFLGASEEEEPEAERGRGIDGHSVGENNPPGCPCPAGKQPQRAEKLANAAREKVLINAGKGKEAVLERIDGESLPLGPREGDLPNPQKPEL